MDAPILSTIEETKVLQVNSRSTSLKLFHWNFQRMDGKKVKLDQILKMHFYSIQKFE